MRGATNAAPSGGLAYMDYGQHPCGEDIVVSGNLKLIIVTIVDVANLWGETFVFTRSVMDEMVGGGITLFYGEAEQMEITYDHLGGEYTISTSYLDGAGAPDNIFVYVAALA